MGKFFLHHKGGVAPVASAAMWRNSCRSKALTSRRFGRGTVFYVPDVKSGSVRLHQLDLRVDLKKLRRIGVTTRNVNCSNALVAAWLGATIALLASLVGTTAAISASPSFQGFGSSLWSGSNSPFLDLSRSPGWLRGLSMSAFAQTTSGMWVNSSGLTNFGRSAGEHHGANSLAVERNLLQLDVNYLLNGDNSAFVRFW